MHDPVTFGLSLNAVATVSYSPSLTDSMISNNPMNMRNDALNIIPTVPRGLPRRYEVPLYIRLSDRHIMKNSDR